MATCHFRVSRVRDTEIFNLISHRFPNAKSELSSDSDMCKLTIPFPILAADQEVCIEMVAYSAVNKDGNLIQRHVVRLVAKGVWTEPMTDDLIRVFINYKNNV